MSRWRTIPLGQGLGEHAALWDELNRRQMGEHPLLTSSFVGGLLRNFGNGRQYLCVLEGEAGPEAMCVMQRRAGPFWSTFLPSQTQLGPLIARSGEQLQRLVSQLPGIALAADMLCVDPDCLEPGSRQEAGQAVTHAVTMNVALRGGFDEYWNARPSQLKKNIRRYERRALEENLPVRVVTHRARPDVEAAVLRYAALESAGWKGAAGTALSPDNQQGGFYRTLLAEYAERGGAYVYELWLGDQLAASRLLIEAGHMLVILKTTYDEGLDRFAPGRLLLKYVLERSFAEHPGKVVEFYTDATQDQLAWATGQRPIRHWTFYRSTTAERAVATLRIARHLVLRRSGAAAKRPLVMELHDGVAALPADAVRLLDSAEHTSIQFGADWFRAMTAAVFKGANIRICVVRENGACVAVVPALLTRKHGAAGVEALANYYTAVYAPATRPGIKAEVLVPALNALAEAAGGASRFTFAPMDPSHESYQLVLSALQLAGWVPFKFFCFGNWVLRWQGSWADYEGQLDSRIRNTIARTRRRFDARGGRLEIVKDPHALGPALDAYVQVYARSWKNAEPFPNFLPELVRTFGPRGCLRLGLAWLGERPIAAQLWFVAGGRADIYKLAHDEAYKEYSPGTLLTSLMLREVMEVDRVQEVDYLIGDDPYKKDWMSLRRERWGIVAYNPRTLAGVFGLLREATGRGLRRLFKAQTKPGSVTSSVTGPMR